MTLDEARRKLPFLLYDELDFEEENELSALLAEHAELREELDRLRVLFRAVDQSAVEPPPGLLSQCRTRLHGTLDSLPAPANRPAWKLADWLRSADSPRFWRMPLGWQAAGALAMLLLGVAAGRWTMGPADNMGQWAGSMGKQAGGFVSQPAAYPPGSGWIPRVREIRSNPDGTVRIEVEEVKHRLVEGLPQDQNVRTLLLAAAQSTSDPGIRVGTLGLLSAQKGQPAVRDVLVHALRHDNNPGVRLKALEGLEAYAAENEVREALRQALLHDENPSVRLQAVDLLTRDSDRPGVIGLLQEHMRYEENRTVRERCQSVLADLNATTETL